MSLGHRCHHYLGLPYGNPTLSSSFIQRIASLSKGFLDLMLQAKLSDPIMLGPWARSANNSVGHTVLG